MVKGTKNRGMALLMVLAMLFSLLPAGITASANSYLIQVDGMKDSYWDTVASVAGSDTAGWNAFHINQLKLTNDEDYLYYWIDAVNVGNWGTEGQFINLALLTSTGGLATSSANPWAAQFNFNGAMQKPDFHLVHRVKNANEIASAALYSNHTNEALYATWNSYNAIDVLTAASIGGGFEGRIPLNALGIAPGDQVSAIAVLSGNNSNEHGVLDVIPEHPDNQLMTSWNVSAEPNILSVYSSPYTITSDGPAFAPQQLSISDGAINQEIDIHSYEIEFNQSFTVNEMAYVKPSISHISDITITTLNNKLILSWNGDLQYNTEYMVHVPKEYINELQVDLNFSFETKLNPSNLNTFTINYYRYDQDYSPWDVWLWTDQGEGYPVTFSTPNNDGWVSIQLTIPERKINFIVRKPATWDKDVSEDRSYTLPEGQTSGEVWLLQGNSTVFASKPSTEPGLLAAFLDSFTTIHAYSAIDINAQQLPEFKLIDVAANTEYLLHAQAINNKQYKLTIPSEAQIDVKKHYIIRQNNMGDKTVTPRLILDAPQFVYYGDDLGLTYSPSSSSFKVWAPTASQVSVAIYSDAGVYNSQGIVEDHSGGVEHAMTLAVNGVWETSISGNLSGQYYMYKVHFADGTVHYVVDPYAKAVSANGSRTAIIDMEQTNPTNWSSDEKPAMGNPTDAIIYELHVRDFSISDSSNVNTAYKGKYLAFTETGLVDADGNSLGIDHLAELGITHVHLLPVYDFKTVNELEVDNPASSQPKFNWGYDPQNYNVPEGSYSTDPTNPNSRIVEFKQMVQALHERGIRVVMDVVYNHTFEIENGPFNKIVPGYFYRTYENGNYSNGSGVGNEIATERPMVRKYIKDSVRYWAEEYHIDGFRFDLMGIIDTTTMEEITRELHTEVDSTMLIYGEPWMGGGTPLPASEQTTKGAQRDKNFAVFNDNIRSAIKGDSDGEGKGFATGSFADSVQGILNGIEGATSEFTNAPTETINYVTAHDNLNLWDKVTKTQGLYEELGMISILNGELVNGGNVEDAVAAANPYRYVDEENVLANETVKRSLLANGIVLTSQGIPFIHAGDELLRTKFGDHNSYRSPDSVNQIRWNYKASFIDVYDYYKGLIELRKEHPAFRMTEKADVDRHLSVLESREGFIAFKLGEYANYDAWKNIIVIYNAHQSEQIFRLPSTSGIWNIVVDDKAAGTSTLSTVTDGTVQVPALSMMVLYDEAKAVNKDVSSITIHAPKQALQAGQQMAVSAKVLNQNGEWLVNEQVLWSSSDSNVATVSANGLVKAVADGDVTITATSAVNPDIFNQFTLKVTELRATTIEINGLNFVYEGYTEKLTAIVKDQFNQIMSDQVVQWSVSDSNLASVSAHGVVTGIAPGVVTVYAHIGAVSASKALDVKLYEPRYIEFEYTRPDSNYDGWDLWVWNTGVVNDNFDFTVRNGKAYALVEIAPTVTSIGFIVRKGGDAWEAKDPDGDRSVHVRLDEQFIKVKLTSGQFAFKQTEYISGPVFDGNNVTFLYRDEQLYSRGTMNEIQSVALKIGDSLYPMQYDDDKEYFIYRYENIAEGRTDYSFVVTKNNVSTEILDPKNNVNGESYIYYEAIAVTGSASVYPNAIDYTKNAVLTVQLSNDDTDINEIYADLTAIGGPAKLNIDKKLKEVSIAVSDHIVAGNKTIPVTVKDRNNVSHTFNTTISVQTRQITGADDFDWDEARIYFLLTDRFANGDLSNDDPNHEQYDTSHLETYHGGDIQGIINNLDYLDELGINTIWITPIVDNVDWNVGINQPWQNQYGYHGYWAKDFTKMDEHLGDIETFKQLIEQAHARGIKIMVDVVLNHVGYGMRESDIAPSGATNYPTSEDRLVFDGMIRKPAGAGDIQGDLSGLPDLTTELDEVREQIVQWQVDWLERVRTDNGDTIDYFRVDTVKHVEETTWMHLKNELTKASPSFKLIGEAFGASAEVSSSYLASGQMDSLLDFGFKEIASAFINGNVDRVAERLKNRNDNINNVSVYGQFLSSHDEDGFLISHAGNDKGKMKVAAALQMMSKGQPVIYYGEEIGLSGRNANFGQQIYGENRYDMQWTDLDEQQNAMLSHYKKLLSIRESYSKILSKGSFAKVAGSDEDGYLVFERAYKGSNVFVGLNIEATTKQIEFDVDFPAGARLVDQYSGKRYTVTPQRTVRIELPSRDDGGTAVLAYIPSGSTPADQSAGEEETSITVQPNHVVNGVIKVELTGVITDIVLDFAQFEGLADYPLMIQSGTFTIIISKDELKELQVNGRATISLKAEDTERMKELQAKALKQNMKATWLSEIMRFEVKQNGSVINRPVTIQFSDSSGADGRLVGIYRITESGEFIYIATTKQGEGDYSALITEPGSYALLHYDKQFNDVVSNHWALQWIKEAAAKQLVVGRTVEHFAPNENITRAEFTEVLVRLLGLSKLDEPSPFIDVASDSWYAGAVHAAYVAGLIQGRSEQQFVPTGTMTREEMVILIVRASELALGTVLKNEHNVVFSDQEEIALWAREAIDKAVAAGFISGKGNNLLDPKGQLTRAEAVKVLMLLYELVRQES